MVTQVPLTQGLVAIVDDDDAATVLVAGKWHAHGYHRTHYARRNVRRPDGSRTTLLLHTFLTGWSYVDHRNGDGLDNRRSNLRPATNAQNARNGPLRMHNTSGYRGVFWNKRDRVWHAKIGADYRLRHLGTFPDPISAAHAYDAAARELHGEFARLNFPAVTS